MTDHGAVFNPMTRRKPSQEADAPNAAPTSRPHAEGIPRFARLWPVVQAKLSVGRVDDPEEFEADRVAERVVAESGDLLSDGSIRREIGVSSGGGSPEEAPALRRKSAAPVRRRTLDAVEEDEELQLKKVAAALPRGATLNASPSDMVPGRGEPLPRYLRARFEPRFGASLAHVRVHHSGAANTLAKGLGARAYTLGRHIVFGAGEYSPGSGAGRRLLAHEIAHTFQQGAAGRAGPIRRQPEHRHRIFAELYRVLQSGFAGPELAAFVLAIPEPFRGLAVSVMQSIRLMLVRAVRDGSAERDKVAPWIHSLDIALQLTYGQVAQSQAPAGTVAPEGGWAPGAAPADLLFGIRTPTAAERVDIGRALSPVRTVGGRLPTFQERVGGVGPTYGQRVKDRIKQWIDGAYSTMVVGRGEAEHSDPTKVHPMSRFVDIAAIAKRETDAVFGSYARGPAFSAGVNLFDQWQEEKKSVKGDPASGVAPMSAADRRSKARALVSYAMYTDGGVAVINDEHGAVPSRAAEKAILDPIRDHFASGEETRLIEIDRGWPATAGGGKVNLQLWRGDTEKKDREIMWDAFQTMIHEYLHTLAHPNYENYADTYGYEAPEYNTLMEGVDSLLTEIVWSHVRPRAPAIQAEVEGAAYAGKKFDSSVIPDIRSQRYASYHQAMAVVNIVGIENLYAAYFLGEVNLIRASTP